MDHSPHMTHLSSVAPMALGGLTLVAVVPGVMWPARRAPLWERVSLPPGVALPALVVLHAWSVLADLLHPMSAAVTAVSELVLLTAAVTFWVPVVARTRHRLSDPGRCLYLFLAAPLLDLPVLGLIATGRSAEGLAMMVGMLPLGIAAAALTWSWINREERQAADALPLTVRPGDRHAR